MAILQTSLICINAGYIYKVYLSQLGDVLEMIPATSETTPWFVDVYLDNPQSLLNHLRAHRIGSRLVYPPISEQKIYANGQNYPVSKDYCHRGLWLPSSVSLTNEQIIGICDLIKERILQFVV